MMMLRIVLICCWLAILLHPTLALGGWFRPPVFPKFQLSGKRGMPFNFLTVGDWGRKGLFNQSLVAHQMGEIGGKMGIKFVISTGDNFYDDGLKSSRDPLFLQSFKNIYTAKSLQVPWYNVLGNHDYRGDVSVQIGRVLPKMDKRWFCLRNYILNTGLVDIFFVDTTPFVNKYFRKDGKHIYDWRGIQPRQTYMHNILMGLEKELKKSSARWKMVVGHHPIRSVGRRSDTMELVTWLLPILEENDVDMYMNGHNHCLEHLTSNTSSIHFLTSGAGSRISDESSGKSKPQPKPEIGGNVKYYYKSQGFMSVGVSHSYANITFFDVYGKALHNVNLLKK